jgi:mono/diheme cytochrome c family protein
LLEKHCTECHGKEKQKADLRLDLRPHAFKGGPNGPVIVPGDSAKSPLLQRVLSEEEDERMPPKGARLTAAETALLKAWIEAGASWPETEADRAASIDKRLEHWAYQPLRPMTPGAGIDGYIDEALQKAGLRRSPEAPREVLLRRLTYDLTGLPPTPEEVAAFVADTAQDAYEKRVDQLLASPRYGERWARHWLDVVRFAESDGFEMNRHRPNAWHYRDYVIRSLNEDKPYTAFLREQLAGDLLGEDAATGFLVGGAVDRVRSPDKVLSANQRADELHDMVSTVGAAFLGLTINCARCHDHKFDPIPARDYYALKAVLEGVQHGERPLRPRDFDAKRDERGDVIEKRADELRKTIAPLEAELAKFRPPTRNSRIVLLDDSAIPAGPGKAGIRQIEQPKNGAPLEYAPGRERGQAGDPGDLTRLPNLGTSYRYWVGEPGKPEDVFAWEPQVSGRYRIWVSWGAWTTHTRDARYVLDRDGNPATKDDQVELARVDQSQFAEGTPAVPEQRRWSGFRLVGESDLTAQSVLLLRTGETGGPTVAEVVAFEEVTPEQPRALQPALRLPVSHLKNEDRFAPVEAKYFRFTITRTEGAEPCLDELEIYPPENQTQNLVRKNAKITVSGTFANGANPLHQAAHLNDGKYGNDFSWISNERRGGWIQVEFAKPERIERVVWSRDRRLGKKEKPYQDRLATGYRMEVSLDGHAWTPVASSEDRLDPGFRNVVTDIPTLPAIPADKAAEVRLLAEKASRLNAELAEATAKMTNASVGYVGRFAAPGPTHRFHRGDPMQPREEVQPGALSQIGHALGIPKTATESERRLALADWLVDPANPLPARVAVNRIWHYHFGTGLVDTPSDFGINGGRPTHPELLDWLATFFIQNGWSFKKLHRTIVLSGTYRQSGQWQEEAGRKDAGARLLWRFPPRRLEAEALRDSMLTVAGKLDLRMGGPGFDLFEPNENYVKVYKTRTEYTPEAFRRMVYQSKPRAVVDDFFGAFDCPDAGQPAPKRTSSTTPLQALNLLNSGFALQQAGYLAERVRNEAGEQAEPQIQRLYALLYGRAPSAQDLADCTALLREHGLQTLCRALLNSNEFIHLY